MTTPLDLAKKLRHKTQFRIAFFYFLGFFLSFIFWLLVKTNFDIVFLTTEGIQSLILSLFSLLFFCLFFSFFGNTVYFFKKFYLALGLVLTINLPYLIIFGLNLLTFEGFFILMFCFYLWAKRIHHYDERHAPFNPLLCTRIGLRTAITIFIFVLAFSFYVNIAHEGQINYFIPRLENYTISLTHQSLKFLLPGYDKNLPIDKTLKLSLENKLWQRFLGPEDLDELSSPQAVLALKQSIENKLEISLEGKRTNYLVSFFIHDYVTNNLLKYQNVFSGAAALAFFLFLKLFSGIYYLLIRAFAWCWIKFFLATKVIDKKKEVVEIEKLVI